MDPLTAAAASGLQARMDSLDLLANNLANTSTSGFKADREFYSSYFSPEATGLDPAVGDSPVVEKRWTDFAQGPLLSTGNPTDLALSGSGFFAVNGPNGPLYTRNGSFQISSQGRLSTAEGYAVRLTGGQTLQVQPGGAPLQISADGQVAQNGVPLGQLQLVNFKTPSQLVKAVGTYFEDPDPAAMPPVAAANLEVAQGKIESSNAQPAESAARLVMLLRHSEMLEHAVKLGADMNRQAVEEVARINS